MRHEPSRSIQYTAFGGAQNTLEFPADQLQALLSLALQVERQQEEKRAAPGKVKYALLVTGIEMVLDQQNQNVIFDFQVGKARFAFSVPREHAVKIVTDMSNLPTNA